MPRGRHPWFVVLFCLGHFHGVRLFARSPHVVWSKRTKSGLLDAIAAFSQEKEKTDSIANDLDTNYVVSFPNHLMGRVYLSRKYTNMVILFSNIHFLLGPTITILFIIG